MKKHYGVSKNSDKISSNSEKKLFHEILNVTRHFFYVIQEDAD